jgi:hypothetical protein
VSAVSSCPSTSRAWSRLRGGSRPGKAGAEEPCGSRPTMRFVPAVHAVDSRPGVVPVWSRGDAAGLTSNADRAPAVGSASPGGGPCAGQSSPRNGADPRPRETRPAREARRAVTADLGAFESRADRLRWMRRRHRTAESALLLLLGGVRLRSGSPAPQPVQPSHRRQWRDFALNDRSTRDEKVADLRPLEWRTLAGGPIHPPGVMPRGRGGETLVS